VTVLAPTPARAPARAYAVWLVGLLAYAVAVFHRASLGVAGVEAQERFSAGASALSLFLVLQLGVYAAMQIPVGVLVDRFGSRLVIAAGALVMAAGQALLAVNGLGDLPLFTVPESVLTGGLLPEYLLDPLMTWLRSTAHDPTMRQATIAATVNGMFDDLPRRLGAVAEGLIAQAEAAERLRTQADLAYSAERAALHDAIAQGELLRGTPLLEWQAMIAPDRAASLFTSGDPAAATARRLLLGAAADQVAAAASRAADQVASAWREALADQDGTEALVSAFTRAGAVPPELEEWADGLVDLVAREPHHKRSDAQFFAAGRHGPAAVLTAVVLTGRRGAAPSKRRRALRPASAEPAVHPVAAATRRLADAVFGADEADRLAQLAATSLDTALGALFDRLAFRHHRALTVLGVESGAGKALLEAGQAVQKAR